MPSMKELQKLTEHVVNIFVDPSYRFESLGTRGYYNHLSDEEYIKRMFKARIGYELDLEHPVTFNEKLQWLKLHDHNPKYVAMVDKYEVKKYVASVIGEEYVIPTLGVWDRFDEIDFSILPNQFVLKCTHDSGGLVIATDKKKLNIRKTRKKIEKSLRRNYYYFGREWPYRDVKPRIIAEKYMEDKDIGELRDYKFFCFNGTVKCYKIDYDRFLCHRANYYTPDGTIMKLGEVVCPPDFDRNISQPNALSKMIAFATQLSCGIPFLRCDFYYVDGKIYFGELTFYPNGGFGKFCFNNNDCLLGSWLQLPKEN